MAFHLLAQVRLASLDELWSHDGDRSTVISAHGSRSLADVEVNDVQTLQIKLLQYILSKHEVFECLPVLREMYVQRSGVACGKVDVQVLELYARNERLVEGVRVCRFHGRRFDCESGHIASTDSTFHYEAGSRLEVVELEFVHFV